MNRPAALTWYAARPKNSCSRSETWRLRRWRAAVGSWKTRPCGKRHKAQGEKDEGEHDGCHNAERAARRASPIPTVEAAPDGEKSLFCRRAILTLRDAVGTPRTGATI